MISVYLRSFSIQYFLLLLVFQNHHYLHVVDAQNGLSPGELREGIDNNSFDAIIDVRTDDEWKNGHLPTATHVSYLQSSTLPPFPKIMGGQCNQSTRVVVVYCRSGARAGVAIDKLIAAGYGATLYNGMGISQWTGAGYELVNTESKTPSCSRSKASKTSKVSKTKASTFKTATKTLKLSKVSKKKASKSTTMNMRKASRKLKVSKSKTSKSKAAKAKLKKVKVSKALKSKTVNGSKAMKKVKVSKTKASKSKTGKSKTGANPFSN